MAHSSRIPAAPLPEKAQQRNLFHVYRAAGHSVTASARMAGINRATGTRWEAEGKRVKAEQELASPEQQTQRAAIASKVELAEQLTSALYLVEPADVPSVASTLSKMMGYDSPTRTEQIIVHASVAQWIDARNELPAAPAKALPSSTEPGEPPK